MKKVLVSMIIAASVLVASDGAKLYSAKCAECHGSDGKDSAISGKVITGGGTLAKLTGYKAGSYGGAQKETMQTSLSGISDGDLKAIAAHVDILK